MNKRELILLVGPSGVGKGTISKKLFENKSLKLVPTCSVTTRKKRSGEKNRQEYYFVDEQKFDKWISQDAFVEWNKHFSNRYGTLHSEIDQIIKKNLKPLIEIETNGALNILKKYQNRKEEIISFFIMPPNFEELLNRIRKRNTESEKQIKARLIKAKKEIKLAKNFNYVITNDDLDLTIKKIEKIIKG